MGLIKSIIDTGARDVVGDMRRSQKASGEWGDTAEGVIDVTEIKIEILEFDTPTRRESPLDTGADCPPSLCVAEASCSCCGRDYEYSVCLDPADRQTSSRIKQPGRRHDIAKTAAECGEPRQLLFVAQRPGCAGNAGSGSTRGSRRIK